MGRAWVGICEENCHLRDHFVWVLVFLYKVWCKLLGEAIHNQFAECVTRHNDSSGSCSGRDLLITLCGFWYLCTKFDENWFIRLDLAHVGICEENWSSQRSLCLGFAISAQILIKLIYSSGSCSGRDLWRKLIISEITLCGFWYFCTKFDENC